MAELRDFYVTVPAHVTFYKYRVRAESLEEAKALWESDPGVGGGNTEYVGYIDGDWDAPNMPSADWDNQDDWVEGVG